MRDIILSSSRGKCEVCGTKCVKSEEVSGHDEGPFSSTVHKSCPNCGFNPGLKDEIERLLEEKAKFSCSPGKPLKMNTVALAKAIAKAVKNKWPKKK